MLTIPNNVLQGELGLAGKNTARFVVNSTIGILGLFDPASKIGLNITKRRLWSNFRKMGSWNRLLYLVLPILGPSH